MGEIPVVFYSVLQGFVLFISGWCGVVGEEGGCPRPLFVPGRANPPGIGVGGLPVNPPPQARGFRGLLTFGSP